MSTKKQIKCSSYSSLMRSFKETDSSEKCEARGKIAKAILTNDSHFAAESVLKTVKGAIL